MKKLIGLVFIIGLLFYYGCCSKTGAVCAGNGGQVCFKVEPASSEVYVDGRYMGRANEFMEHQGCLDLPVGRHSIRLSHQGFEDYYEDISLGKGARWIISVKLDKAKGGPHKEDKGKGGDKDKDKGNGKDKDKSQGQGNDNDDDLGNDRDQDKSKDQDQGND